MRHYGTFGLIAAIAFTALGCTSQQSAQTNAIAAEAVAIESGAKSSVSSLLFDQQTYFMENDKFATSLSQLKSGLLAETSNYRYKITPQPSKQKGIAITATSKTPKLRSFTGVAFAVKLGKDQMTVTQICETNKPSQKAPIAPQNPRRASDKLPCPAGSRNSDDAIAMKSDAE
jgi:type IV pilus assembly protein PilA